MMLPAIVLNDSGVLPTVVTFGIAALVLAFAIRRVVGAVLHWRSHRH